MGEFNLKKTFLYLLIASIAVSALLGIWAILSGEFGELQSRILSSTLTVVGASLLGLPCGAFWESPKSRGSALKFVPILGVIFTIITAITVFLLIWDLKFWKESDFFKFLGVAGAFAFSFAQLSLLSLANLAPKFKWALIAAYVVILSLATIVSLILIFEPYNNGTILGRIIGVLAITDAALTVTIPILHRLSKGNFSSNKNEIERIDIEIARLESELSDLRKQREEIANNLN